jgi:Rrf2 family iron-sulfur cluster assembly transcriptional regulator
MLDLAIHDRFGPVTLLDISENQHISLSYLEQLFAKLRKGGLVEGTRGPGGGYRLAKTSEAITIADIVMATDGSLGTFPQASSTTGLYYNTECTITHELWKELSRKIYEFLNSITLAYFVQQPEVQAAILNRNGLHVRSLPSNLGSKYHLATNAILNAA